MTFRRIHVTRLWHEPRMRALRRKSCDAHDLYVYARTCPQGNLIGLYQLLEEHALLDLRWTRARYRKALRLLVDAGLVVYDAAAQVIYLPAVLEEDPVSTERQAIGAVRCLTALPTTPLVERLKQDLLARGVPKVAKPENLRPLLSHLGLVGEKPLSDSGQIATHAPASAPATATVPTYGAEPTDFQLGGRRNGHAPLTRAERLFEERILPLTGEITFRDDWLRILKEPGAIVIAEEALRIVEGHTGTEKPGAMLWFTFKKLRGDRTAGVA